LPAGEGAGAFFGDLFCRRQISSKACTPGGAGKLPDFSPWRVPEQKGESPRNAGPGIGTMFITPNRTHLK